MKTLIIYDATGYIISNITGSYHVPTGVPFLEVKIPEGKRIATVDGVGVDVTKTPHEVILEDVPPSEMELLKEKAEKLELTIDTLLSDVIPAILAGQ